VEDPLSTDQNHKLSELSSKTVLSPPYSTNRGSSSISSEATGRSASQCCSPSASNRLSRSSGSTKASISPSRLRPGKVFGASSWSKTTVSSKPGGAGWSRATVLSSTDSCWSSPDPGRKRSATKPAPRIMPRASTTAPTTRSPRPLPEAEGVGGSTCSRSVVCSSAACSPPTAAGQRPASSTGRRRRSHDLFSLGGRLFGRLHHTGRGCHQSPVPVDVPCVDQYG